MKRRLFLQSLSAFFAAPVLPMQALVAAPMSTSAPPAGAVYWAKYLAKYYPTCTEETLRSLMGVTEKTARAVHQHLVSQQVLSPLGVVNTQMAGQLSQAATQARTKPATDEPRFETASTRDSAERMQVREADHEDVLAEDSPPDMEKPEVNAGVEENATLAEVGGDLDDTENKEDLSDEQA